MGQVYMKDKPEASSFSYAYVEDADGKLVRVSVANLKAVLGTSANKTEITLSASGWTSSSSGTYFTQNIPIDGVTANSKIDLDATPEQIIQLMEEDVTLFVANNEGTITAYSVNGRPSTDMVFDITITEVA